MKRDLIIVGAGPAGASTGLFLTALDPSLADRIEVVDLARFPREKICAGAVGARAEKLLATIGVQVDVPSAAVDGVSLKFAKGSAVSKVGGIGRVVRRVEFDDALREALVARGVTVTQGVKVTGLRRDGAKLIVESTGGEEREATMVIGADGVRSAVRQAIGVEKGTLTAQAVEVDTDPTPKDLPRDLLHFDFCEAGVGYGWDFPTVVDGREMVCRGQYQLDWENEVSVDVSQRLEEHLVDSGVAREGKRFKRFAVRGLELHRPMAAAGVLLVGEAAGVDPLLGEGIAQSIASGALAAEYLVEKLRRGALDFGDWRSVFARSPTGLDTLARISLVSVFRNPISRRFLEHMTLATPESLDVVLAVSGGKPVPTMSAAVAGLKAAVELARMPLRESRGWLGVAQARLREWVS